LFVLILWVDVGNPDQSILGLNLFRSKVLNKRVEDEKDKTYFRVDRLYFVSGKGWYFLTRDDYIFGPYITKSDAEADLSLFLFTFEIESWGDGCTGVLS
jgi:hypothetical protein